MGFNSFRGRVRGRGKYTAKGRRKYHGSKKLKRLARRARYRTSARAQGKQIAKVAGSLASVKGKRNRADFEHPQSVKDFAYGRAGVTRSPAQIAANRAVATLSPPFKKAAIGLARRAAANYDYRIKMAFDAYDWFHSIAGPIHDHSDML